MVVVDDDAMVRTWVRESLLGTPFEVVGDAASADAAERLVERRRPEIVLLDFRLGETAAVDLLRRLRRGGFDALVLLFTASPVVGLNELALESGAQGCLIKTGSADELVTALGRVAGGELVKDPRNPPAAAGPRLTSREREVLRLIAAGKTNREIAEEIHLSVSSVKTLQARAAGKLGTSRRTETVIAAKTRGWL